MPIFQSHSSESKADEEPPAKLLDDLFRKTKATPCIYWLPLTEEQVCLYSTQFVITSTQLLTVYSKLLTIFNFDLCD